MCRGDGGRVSPWFAQGSLEQGLLEVGGGLLGLCRLNVDVMMKKIHDYSRLALLFGCMITLHKIQNNFHFLSTLLLGAVFPGDSGSGGDKEAEEGGRAG